MQKNKPILLIHDDANVATIAYMQTLLQHMVERYSLPAHSSVHQAISLAQLTGSDKATPTGQSCLQQGLQMAAILMEIQADPETLSAGIVYHCVQDAALSLDDVEEQLGGVTSKLIRGVIKMATIQGLHEQIKRAPAKNAIDNLRKMLLAMVDDVRIVLIKLAERLAMLRFMRLLPESEQRYEAKMTLDIYAPLANRLGIGHLKWELEDLSFRYLQPALYKEISQGLKATRQEREAYVKKVIILLQQITQHLGISNAEVSGRAKHIYSIYRKMIRKNASMEEIYDVTAFRVLVPTIENCYGLLGHCHGLWKPIPKEFDDYITKPKSNGYRSIHTAVFGPDNKIIEIQIRTFTMNEEAELGVAAHWIYKEGQPVQTGYEAKIAWLRQLMDWQKELIQEGGEPAEKLYSQVFDDCIYVFTPQGDVLEMVKDATPLDFAYHIHTNLGHRCRGCKVNGQIVPLTYHLKTGEIVEVLTAKEPHPSRDWLNPNLGYLKTSRAKAKVLHWFRQQNLEKNLADGEALVEKELRRLGIKGYDLHRLAERMKCQSPSDLYIALGRGDLTLSTFLHHLQEILTPSSTEDVPITRPATVQKSTVMTEVEVEGVGNLLTHIALCCKPIPGDPVIGYITQGHGVSIHRQDCSNILHGGMKHQERLIPVDWGNKTTHQYTVDILVEAYHRPSLIRDITQLLLNERISLIGLNSVPDKKDHTVRIHVSVEIQGLNRLSRLMTLISQLPDVLMVRRA